MLASLNSPTGGMVKNETRPAFLRSEPGHVIVNAPCQKYKPLKTCCSLPENDMAKKCSRQPVPSDSGPPKPNLRNLSSSVRSLATGKNVPLKTLVRNVPRLTPSRSSANDPTSGDIARLGREAQIDVYRTTTSASWHRRPLGQESADDTVQRPHQLQTKS